MTTSIEMRDRIVSLIEDAKVSVPSTRQLPVVAEEMRKISGVDETDRLCFRDHEFEIKLSLLEYLEEEVAILKQIAPLSLAAAPEVVDLLPISETQFDGALILQYAACPGERLERAETTKAPFRPDAAARFRDDMRKLAAAGFVHSYIDGLFHWLVSSETGTIVLESWGAIEPATPKTAREMLSAVDGWLESRS